MEELAVRAAFALPGCGERRHNARVADRIWDDGHGVASGIITAARRGCSHSQPRVRGRPDVHRDAGKEAPPSRFKTSRILPVPVNRSINVKSDAETVTSCTFERRSHTRTAQLQHVAHSRQPYAAGITRARVSAPSWAPLSPPRQIASRETGPRFPPIASRSVRSRLFLAHAPLQIRQAGASDECELLGGKTTFQRCARPAQPGCVAQGRLARFRDLGMQYSR